MPKFFASCPRGLELPLVSEIEASGAKRVIASKAGVYFESNWQTCYSLNLSLKTASRILYPVLDFVAYNPDEIYHNILKHDWTKYISLTQTLAVHSQVKNSVIRDLRIVSLKVKDAVVDQYRDKFGKRPDVDSKNPDLPIMVRLVNNQVTVALDTTGEPLHERGYREMFHEAPIKENLAASLVALSGWTKESPLVDPMCGSATILCEAFIKGTGSPPRPHRTEYAFKKWKTFKPEDLENAVRALNADDSIESAPLKLYGFDKERASVAASWKNSEKLGAVIHFEKTEIRDLQPPTKEPGFIITNPPYGERLEDRESVKKLYHQMGQVLYERFKDWKVFVLVPRDRELTKSFNLQALKHYQVYNGAMECSFVELNPNFMVDRSKNAQVDLS